MWNVVRVHECEKCQVHTSHHRKKHHRERESTGSPVHTRLAAHPHQEEFACNDPISQFHSQNGSSLRLEADYIHSRHWMLPLKMIRLSICYISNHKLTPHVFFHLLSTIGYIGEFEIVDDHRSQKIVVELNGRLNKCGVISPRFDVPVNEVEKWIVNLLPSRQFGHIVLSTTYGIMTHEEAKRKKTGGKVLGFFY